MTEKIVHKQICTYLAMQYKDVIFRTDAAGIRLTIGQAKQMKCLQSPGAYPDLFIAEPRNGYHGLYLEIKKDRGTIYNKKGELRASMHIQDQKGMIERLRGKGYRANFACGFNEAKEIIDKYLK